MKGAALEWTNRLLGKIPQKYPLRTLTPAATLKPSLQWARLIQHNECKLIPLYKAMLCCRLGATGQTNQQRDMQPFKIPLCLFSGECRGHACSHVPGGEQTWPGRYQGEGGLHRDGGNFRQGLDTVDSHNACINVLNYFFLSFRFMEQISLKPVLKQVTTLATP